jgi:hypothetical protein
MITIGCICGGVGEALVIFTFIMTVLWNTFIVHIIKKLCGKPCDKKECKCTCHDKD